MDNRATKRIASGLRRPGMGSLLVLLAGVVVPVPSVTNGGAHLLGLPTACPMRLLFGIPCPGCGMTRALCCCCHGRFAEAVLRYHPAAPLVFGGLIAVALYGLATGRALPERVTTPAALVGMALLFGIWAARLAGMLPWPPR